MKILLLSCKTGGGHDAAANALKEQFEKQGHYALVFDYLTLASEKTAHRVAQLYVKTVQTAPLAFGCAYKAAQLLGKCVKRSPIYYVNTKMIKHLAPYLQQNDYDAIVMTHLYPMETLTAMKRKGINLPPTVAVMTDYTVIPFICETDVDEYIVPHPDLVEACAQGGLKKEKLHPLGIPYSLGFLENITPKEAKTALGLNENKKTVLLIGGSMGAGKLCALAKAFLKNENARGLQIVVICGNNRTLKHKINKNVGQDKRFIVLGSTDKMPLYMKAADVVYTKPGGLTTTEAAASRTPMVITYPIPGCETANKQFFINKNMAVGATSPEQAVSVGLQILSDETKAAEIISAQKNNISDKATQQITDFILNLAASKKSE